MKVSVIIPSYNRIKTLRQAVESAHSLNEVGEVLVVDDGSTDGTKELCNELARTLHKTRILHHPNRSNRGVAASRNLGIESSAHEFIAFLDSDDLYNPWRFEKALSLMAVDDKIDGVYGDTDTIFEGDPLRDWWIASQKPLITGIGMEIPPDDLCLHILWKGECFHTNAITLRKSAIIDVGAFEKKLPMSQDWNLWLKLAMVKHLRHCGEERPLAIRRVHEDCRIYTNRGLFHLRQEIRSLGWLISISRSAKEPEPILDALLNALRVKIHEEFIQTGDRRGRLKRYMTLSLLNPFLLTRKGWLREIRRAMKV